jgi:hypothetical protein
MKEYLLSLGNTSAEVAESLRAQGIKGKILSACHCPILNGIYSACPNYWPGLRIVNGRKQSDGHWYYSATLDDPQIMDPSLPAAVMDFIGDFDAGLYPDLVCKVVKEVTRREWS